MNEERAMYYASLAETARRIETRAISPVELTQSMLERIATVDDRLKSYATVMPESALAAARVAEEQISAGEYRGPLHGVPFPIAKEIQYAGMKEVDAALHIDFRLTAPANFAGTPTLSLPCGYTEDGLPHSIQLWGKQLSEPLLCRIGHAYEEATGWYKRHPDA